MADKFMKSLTFVEGGDAYYPLPKVTNADDGKVLKVVNGAWSLEEYPKNIVKIEVTTAPTTVNYIEGDSLDLTGLVVTATFDDGSTKDVTSQCTMSPAAGTVLATTDTSVSIIYTYKGVTRSTSQLIVVEVPPCLSFIGNEDFTLKTYNTSKNWDGKLEYSTDKSTWSTWNGTEISSASSKLYLRGTGNTNMTGWSESSRFVFTGTSSLNVSCDGNIESLLDCKTVMYGDHPTMATNCYQYMFYGCTSLTTAPALPATTLASNCYAYMFSGCTALTAAPALPATTLAMSCYQCMFKGCTSLTTAPSLPATTLTDYCYQRMFDGCTSLTTAPSLPATTLATNCYQHMFNGCTSLTTVSALPATTLANYCYQYMFQGCSLIKLSTSKTGAYTTSYRIPTSGTGTTGTNSLANMFANTGGTFTGTPSINTTYYTSNTVV